MSLVATTIFFVQLTYFERKSNRTVFIARGGVVLWSGLLYGIYLPLFLQPPWGITNAGDATHQVLEEISGPLVGHFPGINAVSTYTTLLGVPLTVLRPLHLPGFFRMHVVIVWVNVLVLLVPFGMTIIAKRLLNLRSFVTAALFVIPIVSVSGRWGAAASNFESLSMIPGRTLLPLILGGSLISLNRQTTQIRFIVVGAFAVLTAFNNVEFGVPAALAAVVVVVCVARTREDFASNIRNFGFGAFGAFSALIALSLLVRGEYDFNFRVGSYAGKPYSPAQEFPAWSTHNLILALCAIAIVIGFKSFRSSHIAANSSAIYFGLWGLFAFPYCSYRCNSGMYMSTQVYFVPAVMACISIIAIYKAEVSRAQLEFKDYVRISLPVVVLSSLAISALMQAPNPIDEWERVLNEVKHNGWSSGGDRPLPDQWNIKRIDWLRPDDIRRAAALVGSNSLGYFGYMGNSVQLATGINNLTRINSGEVLQVKGTRKIEELACREVDESQPRYIIVVGIDFPCSGYTFVPRDDMPDTVQIWRVGK